MPIIPLYHSPPNLDAWHRVRSPGGYEWWHFDAEDSTGDRLLAITFYDGYILDPVYRSRFAGYLQHPTRQSPPLPSEFPALSFALYEKGKLLAHFTKQFAAGEFQASEGSLSLKMGTSGAETIENDIQLSISEEMISAQIMFRSVFHPLMEFDLAPKHHWIVADSLCKVEATIQLKNQTVDFLGRGYHDHQFGTEPTGEQSLHGRVLFDDAACAFHLSRDALIVESDSSGAQQLERRTFQCDPGWRTIHCDESLELSNMQILNSSPRHKIVTYDARWRGRRDRAFCTIIQND